MRKVIYSLTGRGLYSELLNLVLAILYCEKNNFKLVLNTYHWNSRLKKGWIDYFSNTLDTTNDIMSAQIYFDGRYHRSTLRQLWYSPIKEFMHYCSLFLNFIYKKTSGNKLSDDIVFKMRLSDFIITISSENNRWIEIFRTKLYEFYIYNDEIEKELNAIKIKLNIPKDNYIGVHIRRGDKIRSKEMLNIQIERYASEIKKHINISNNIYVATDDIRVIKELSALLGVGYKVFYNKFNTISGFDETKFNKKSKEQKFHETKMALLDVEILSKSSYFIGTFSSNLSRIIPCLMDPIKCTSLDVEWNPIF